MPSSHSKPTKTHPEGPRCSKNSHPKHPKPVQIYEESMWILYDIVVLDDCIMLYQFYHVLSVLVLNRSNIRVWTQKDVFYLGKCSSCTWDPIGKPHSTFPVIPPTSETCCHVIFYSSLFNVHTLTVSHHTHTLTVFRAWVFFW